MPSYPNNLIAVGLETGGLDPQRHPILEVAMIQVCSGMSFERKVRLSEALVTPEAVRVNNIDIAHLDDEARVPITQVDNEARAWLNERIGGGYAEFLGKNLGGFDLLFMKRLMPKTADRASYRCVDLSGLYAMRDDALRLERGTTRKSVDALFPGGHTALGDATSAVNQYVWLCQERAGTVV